MDSVDPPTILPSGPLVYIQKANWKMAFKAIEIVDLAINHDDFP
jgi:hypothetical protein